MQSPKQILIGLDLKPSDRDLMAHGLMYAKAFQSSIWMVHVTPPNPDSKAGDGEIKYLSESPKDKLNKEEKILHKEVQAVKKQGISCEGLIIQGPTVEMLIKEVEHLKTELLIIGEKKHGAMYKALMGKSTSSKILKQIGIPVLIVPISNNE